MRIAISIQRNIVRKIDQYGLSNRIIAEQENISHSTVAKIRHQLEQSALSWARLSQLNDYAFAMQLGTLPNTNPSGKHVPDWHVVQIEMQKRDVTLALLHDEYCLNLEKQPELRLCYSQFAARYRDWLNKQRISMRQFHRPGDKMFVDFCGKTMPITCPKTGTKTFVQVFVAVMGASSYTFACAVPTQKIRDWIECHVKALEFFGGTPQQVVPDNLKSAVLKHGRLAIVTNPAYADMAEHYDLLINPARSRKPKDKSLGEIGVQIVQRWVLAPLRKQTFFSIEELNAEIAKRIDKLNAKTSRKYAKSRKERFLELDSPALSALPPHRYENGVWQYGVRVPEDYHVEFGNSYYSVPHQYRGQKVDLRATHSTLEILSNRYRIASHPLRELPGSSTLREHMPIEHQRQTDEEPEFLLEWAQGIGPNTFEWAQKNLQQRRDYANGLKSVRKLRRWAREEQIHHRLESACAYALRLDALPFARLQTIIRNNSDLRITPQHTAWVQEHSNLRGPEYYRSSNQETLPC